jgi:hypothetical protein
VLAFAIKAFAILPIKFAFLPASVSKAAKIPKVEAPIYFLNQFTVSSSPSTNRSALFKKQQLHLFFLV